jgi:hypothetical protein
MANLVKTYYTEKKIPKNKEFIPGDIILFSKTNTYVLDKSKIEELYIVNLNRNPHFITKKCTICDKFHINELKYKNHLGNHWRKYRSKYIDLNLPITNSECYL